MAQGSLPMHIEQVEVFEGEVLRIDDIAQLCFVSPEWVLTRVHSEILPAQWRDGVCYLSSAALWRARQLASIEGQYEADPQLAALVVDLMDELQALRSRLALYEAGQAPTDAGS